MNATPQTPRTATVDEPTLPLNQPRREPTNAELGLEPLSAERIVARAPRPHRRHRLLTAAITVAALGCGAAGAYAAAPQHTSTDAWTVGDVTAVRVELDRGDVEITQSDDGQVAFSEDLSWRGGAFDTEHHVEGGTLVITQQRHGLPVGFNWADRLDYKLALPKGVAVTYSQSAGQARFSGSYGAMDVKLDAGQLDASGLSASSLALRMSAGQATLRGLSIPDVNVRQSAGDSTLAFDTAPTSLKVDTSAGNVDVELPRAARYTVTEKHSAGKLVNHVDTDGSGAHRVDVTLSAGNVTLRGR